MKGNVIPVTGRLPVTTPILIAACTTTIVLYLSQAAPKGSGALIAIFSPLQAKGKKTAEEQMIDSDKSQLFAKTAKINRSAVPAGREILSPLTEPCPKNLPEPTAKRAWMV